MSLLPKNEKVKRDVKNNMSVWVMGNPGEGKTTFAAQFPNPLFINTDGNFTQFDIPSIFLEERMTLDDGSQVWGFTYLLNVIEEFIANNQGYQTLVIDLFEDIVKFAEKMVAAQNGKEFVQDVPWGKGIKMVEELIRDLTTKLNIVDMNVVYLSHALDEAAKNVNGQDIVKIVPKDLKPKLVAMIAGRVKLMALLETISFDKQDVNGNKVLDAQGLPVKDSVKILNFEKSERLPSTVQRFNSPQNYCIATYSVLKELIENSNK